MHDFFVSQTEDSLLIDCEGGHRTEDLNHRLMAYRLRAQVTLSIEPEHAVYALFPLDPQRPADPPSPWEYARDPRSLQIGWRTFETPAKYADILAEVPFEEWDQRRIALTIPDGSRDIEVGQDTLFDAGIDRLNGIDWNKGCYVGQEVTARIRYRGLCKKTLYTIATPQTSTGEVPSPFSNLPEGGSLRSSCAGVSLALLKCGNAERPMPAFTR